MSEIENKSPESYRTALEELSTKAHEIESLLSGPSEGVVKTSSISLSGIRNFTNKIEIPVSTGLTIIYAENGVGKTTLVDALELAESGETTRNGTGLASKLETKDSHTLPSWGTKELEIDITVEAVSGEKWGFKGGNLWRTPSAPDNLYNVVSRRNIRNNVDRKSNDRFKFVSSLTPFSEIAFAIDENIGELKDITRGFREGKKEYEFVEEKCREIGVEIEKVTAEDLDPADFSRLGPLGAANSRIVRAVEAAQKIRTILEKINEIELPDELKESLANVAGIQELAGKSSVLLELALETVQTGCPCPVCEETTITDAHLERISNILSRNIEVLEAQKVRSSNKALIGELDLLNQQLRNMHRSCLSGEAGGSLAAELRDLFNGVECQEVEIPAYPIDRGNENSGGIDLANFSTVRREISDYIEEIDKSFSKYLSDIEAIITREEETRRSLERNGYDRILELWNRLGGTADKVTEQLRILKLAPGLLDAYKNIEYELQELKRDLISSVFSPIEKDILEWWAILKPHSTAFDLSFEFTDYRNHSVLNIWCVSVNGSKKHAMGVLSDSQLDALSLAFYLAAHKRIYGASMLWLDDPTDSLDKKSLVAFCRQVVPKLLSNGTQVVVATHDSQTVSECCSALSQARMDNSGELVGFMQLNLEVLDTSKGGVSVAPHSWKSARDRYIELLAEVDERGARWAIGDRLRLANSLRVYVEHLYADGHDKLQRLFGRERLIGESSSEQKSTLSTYEDYLMTDLSSLRDRLIRVPEDVGGPSRHLMKLIDNALDACARLDKGALNSGSHASSSIPSVSELEISRALIEEHFLWPKANDPLLDGLFIVGSKGDPRPYLFTLSCD